MYYKRPVPGRVRLVRGGSMVIAPDDLDNWRFVEIRQQLSQGFAVFEKNNIRVYQSLAYIRKVRLKPGEDNISAKLTNAESFDILVRANSGEKPKDLAQEFNISTDYVRDIKNFKARIGTHLKMLNKLENPVNDAKTVVASALKNHKLSPGLASFIRKDRQVMRMSVKDLAKKYCVSTRTIQRILANQMYKTEG